MEDTCDACAGTGKPVSGLPCVCGGSGRGCDEKVGLRRAVYVANLQVSEMRQAVQDAYGRLVNMMDTDVGWQMELSERLEAVLGKCAEKQVKEPCVHEWYRTEDKHYFCPKCKTTGDAKFI
jgi:hypothetical protein